MAVLVGIDWHPCCGAVSEGDEVALAPAAAAPAAAAFLLHLLPHLPYGLPLLPLFALCSTQTWCRSCGQTREPSSLCSGGRLSEPHVFALQCLHACKMPSLVRRSSALCFHYCTAMLGNSARLCPVCRSGANIMCPGLTSPGATIHDEVRSCVCWAAALKQLQGGCVAAVETQELQVRCVPAVKKQALQRHPPLRSHVERQLLVSVSLIRCPSLTGSPNSIHFADVPGGRGHGSGDLCGGQGARHGDRLHNDVHGTGATLFACPTTAAFASTVHSGAGNALGFTAMSAVCRWGHAAAACKLLSRFRS